jgi:putative DNA primase/helicase
MVDGCLEWQRQGLNPPGIVTKATEDYFSSEDTLGCWLEECCIQDRKLSASAAALYQSCQEWCQKNGEPVVSKKKFAQKLEEHQFTRERSASMRGFKGLALKSEIPSARVFVADSRNSISPTAQDLGFHQERSEK